MASAASILSNSPSDGYFNFPSSNRLERRRLVAATEQSLGVSNRDLRRIDVRGRPIEQRDGLPSEANRARDLSGTRRGLCLFFLRNRQGVARRVADGLGRVPGQPELLTGALEQHGQHRIEPALGRELRLSVGNGLERFTVPAKIEKLLRGFNRCVGWDRRSGL